MKYFLKTLKLGVFLLTYFIFTFIVISCDKIEKTNLKNSSPRAEMLEHIVPINDAFKMYDTYSQTRNLILRDTLQKLYGEKFYDTRTVWFDIKILKEYIKYVEQKSAENDILPQGIKICFGTYPDDEDLGDMANHQSVFFVPTTENEGRQSAYTLQNEKGVVFLKNIRKTELQQRSIKKDQAGFLTFTTINEDEGLILNRGSGSPPPGTGDPDFE